MIKNLSVSLNPILCGWRDLPLRERIVKNPNLSLSLILTLNEKVEHYICSNDFQ